MEQTALASVRKVKYRSCLTVTPRRTTGRMHVRSGPKQGPASWMNFGKQTGVGGRLNSFRPTLQFYPRDQKEKHVLTCHASGRVYCSNCGSAAVGCQRLAEPPPEEGLRHPLWESHSVDVVPPVGKLVPEERPLSFAYTCRL